MIFTAGHSTLQPDEFLALLAQGGVGRLWDIRSYPVSRWTWFRREELEQWLPAAGVTYRWEPRLGGRRSRPREARPTAGGWREEGFAAYQWHMTTEAFLAAADELIELGRRHDVAVMCSEGVWWRCHRSMVADYLVAAGSDAVHLQPRVVRHSEVIGDRLARYDPLVLAAWRRHLGHSPPAFGGRTAAGM